MWSISWQPHADGNDKGKPWEMQENATPAKYPNRGLRMQSLFYVSKTAKQDIN